MTCAFMEKCSCDLSLCFSVFHHIGMLASNIPGLSFRFIAKVEIRRDCGSNISSVMLFTLYKFILLYIII